MRTVIAWFLLLLSTLGGLIAVYYLLFAVWMTAYYPHGANQPWQVRFYERLFITVADALIWGGSAIWIFLHRNRDRI